MDNTLPMAILELSPIDNQSFQWDNIGMGALFAELHKDKHRFNEDNKKWYTYHDGVWLKNNTNDVALGSVRIMILTLKEYAKHITDEETSGKTKEYLKFLGKCSDEAQCNKILNASKDELLLSTNDFDNNPLLLNCKNGIFNLDTLKFEEHSPSHLQTLQTNAKYLSKVNDKEWVELLDDITEHDTGKKDYLQKALGYSLLGGNPLEKMFIAYGPTTRNGKGTVLNSVYEVLGGRNNNSYGGVMDKKFVCQSKYKGVDFNAPQPMMASLKGKRYVTLSENEDSDIFDSALVKSITGNDPIITRELNAAPFTFLPQFTIWLSTNYLPIILDTTIFKSNRVRVIKFNKSYVGAEDTTLKARLRTEENQSVILNWLIQGYIRYKNEGLIEPESILEETRQYEEKSDRVLCFVRECVQSSEGDKISKTEMYSAYTRWCKDDEQGYVPLGKSKFYQNISTRFFNMVHLDGHRYFKNCKLVNGQENKIII